MSGIRTGIDLQDRMSAVLNRAAAAAGRLVFEMQNLQYVCSGGINTAGINRIPKNLNAAGREINENTSKQEIFNQELQTGAEHAEEMYDSIKRIGAIYLLSRGLSSNNGTYLLPDLSAAGRQIEENTKKQEGFNRKIYEGTGHATGLLDSIKRIGAAYLSYRGVKGIFNASDSLVSTTARLNNMNDGLQTTQDLVKMVYSAAQDSRGSFSDMADVVARFGNNAGDAFDSSAQVVEFASLVQKEMTIAGASTQEAANAELQLSQALGSGVLRGDELNSIFDQAPNLIQTIADYIGVPIGQIREMASEGELTAQIVRDAVLSSADDINAKFESMPMTWGQMWQQMKNTALMEFQPVLDKLNELANNQKFQRGMQGLMTTINVVAIVVLSVMETIGNAASWVSDNWSVIGPIVLGVAAAVGILASAVAAYNIVQGISNGIHAVATTMATIHSAALAMQTGATFAATAAQYGLNAAIMASPITKIVLIIIAAVAAIYAVCQAIANMTGIASTGFGVIVGGINIAIQFFKNLGLSAANIAMGIWSAMSALAFNMQAAFHNSIANIQSFFYNLLSTAASVISSIAAALNQLPFVNFDYSGITAAADNYAAKAQAAASNRMDYKDVGAAFSAGSGTFGTFSSGWVNNAFQSGAALGDSVAGKVSGAIDGFMSKFKLPDMGDISGGTAGGIESSGLGDAAGSAADAAGAAADALGVSEEDLKYLRDIAEQEAINRYTLASVTVNQTNNNDMRNGLDLDGVISGLTSAVNESIDSITEGVHA